MSAPVITLNVVKVSKDAALRLSDTRHLWELSEELCAEMDSRTSEDTLTVSLLPPIPDGLSVRLGFQAITDAWLARPPEKRCSLECLVGSRAAVDLLTPLLPDHCGEQRVFHVGALQIVVLTGDIVATGADAIVNASNTSLRLGGGVSAAIRQSCGPGLAAEMAAISSRHPLADGEAVITGAHGLRTARFIIHVASAAGDDDTVARSIRNVLRLGAQHAFSSIAMPAVGTGTGGMRIQRFADLLIAELGRHALADGGFPQTLKLVAYRQSDAVELTDAFEAPSRAQGRL